MPLIKSVANLLFIMAIYCISFTCSYRYSGEIYGIGNMFATIPGIVAPLLVNTLTPNVSTSIS